MQSKSSTFLATISILAIITVLFMAIVDVEDGPIRKTFGSGNASTEDGKEKGEFLTQKYNQSTETPKVTEQPKENLSTETKPTTDEQIIAETSAISADEKAYFEENFKGIDETLLKNGGQNGQLEFGNTSVEVKQPMKIDTNKALPTDKNVTSELLTKVGYSNFVIRPKPYSGMIFDQFDLSGLSGIKGLEKQIIENTDGNDQEILRIYEFNQETQDTNNQYYDYLRNKFKGELGLTVNESNQFGLASFYINFSPPKENAFLVVKTRLNVYALSYPKVDKDGKSYFELIKKLLSELN